MSKFLRGIAVVVMLAFILPIVGCGGGGTQTQTTAATQAQTEAPTEAQTQAPTEAQTQAQTEAQTQAQTQAQTEAPTQAQTEPPPPPAEQYHIGIATLGYEQSEDEIRGAEALVAKFGSVDAGGIVKHVVLPANFADEQETVITNIAGFADDPLMKAVIVNQGIPGTAAGFQKIRDAGRDDIILLTSMPQDDPLVIANVADVIINSNDFGRGYYDIVRCKAMGATTFVHMSFPRHMSVEQLSRRRNMFEEACKDMGIEFVFVTVPDPASEVGAAGAQQAVYDMMPRLVDQYGKDAVYFTTNTALHEPIIQRCAELGAMFLSQDDMSPNVGYPGALGLDLSAQIGDWWAMTMEIEKEVVARGQAGRMGTWAYSFLYCGTTGLYELAVQMIEGRSSGNIQNDLVAAYQALTPGCEWVPEMFKDPNGNEISNYFLLSMETYILGQGFTDVLSMPIPEKYYSIK
ncbi:MAG: DUF3798 domain-containing protein [Oscillospiraceae bacterium]|nr:DUF3798 domain-containing protein [Oscillospiraceae bacterium]